MAQRWFDRHRRSQNLWRQNECTYSLRFCISWIALGVACDSYATPRVEVGISMSAKFMDRHIDELMLGTRLQEGLSRETTPE